MRENGGKSNLTNIRGGWPLHLVSNMFRLSSSTLLGLLLLFFLFVLFFFGGGGLQEYTGPSGTKLLQQSMTKSWRMLVRFLNFCVLVLQQLSYINRS